MPVCQAPRADTSGTSSSTRPADPPEDNAGLNSGGSTSGPTSSGSASQSSETIEGGPQSNTASTATHSRSWYSIFCAFFATAIFLALVIIPIAAHHIPQHAPVVKGFLTREPFAFSWTTIIGFIGSLSSFLYTIALGILCKGWLRHLICGEDGIGSVEFDLLFAPPGIASLWHENIEHKQSEQAFRFDWRASTMISFVKHLRSYVALFSIFCFFTGFFITPAINTLYQEVPLNKTVEGTFAWPQLAQNPTTLEYFSSCDASGKIQCTNLTDIRIVDNAILDIATFAKLPNTFQAGASIYTAADSDVYEPNGTVIVSQDLSVPMRPDMLAKLRFSKAQSVDLCAPALEVQLDCASGTQAQVTGYEFSKCSDQPPRPAWNVNETTLLGATMQACTQDSNITSLIFGFTSLNSGQFVMECNASLYETNRTISSAVSYDNQSQNLLPSNAVVGNLCGSHTSRQLLPLGPAQNLLRGVANRFQVDFYSLSDDRFTPLFQLFNNLQIPSLQAGGEKQPLQMNTTLVRFILIKAVAAQALSSYAIVVNTDEALVENYPSQRFTLYGSHQAIHPSKSDLIWLIPLTFGLLIAGSALLLASRMQLNSFGSPSESLAIALRSPRAKCWSGVGLESLSSATRKTLWAVRTPKLVPGDAYNEQLGDRVYIVPNIRDMQAFEGYCLRK